VLPAAARAGQLPGPATLLSVVPVAASSDSAASSLPASLLSASSPPAATAVDPTSGATAGTASAATPAASAEAFQDHAMGQPPVTAVEYPAIHFSGFGDIDVSAQSRSEGSRGFSEGQFAMHVAAALSPRVNVFGEFSLTPRTDAGTGTPPATGFNPEVERLLVRFDRSDHLKVSFGRYHTPINYWNTAFHHGSWLQTTISRPEMVQFGSRFIPVHFLGALVEGRLAAHGANLAYQAGIGNGRGNVISRGGDTGDNNGRPAWLVSASSRPDRLYGLQYGGSFYVDRVSVPGRPEFDEHIAAAHLVWDHENPEVIAEITSIRHEQVGGGLVTTSLGYYFQTAYRLPDPARLWKPYVRFEHIDIPAADQVFAGIPELDGTTLGVRYDVITYAAVKAEMRIRRRGSGQPTENGYFLQVCFTF
jgi:hypothetical protein